MVARTGNQLIPRIGDESQVAASWEKFVLAEKPPVAAVRDVVLESWRRSRSVAVDPACHGAPSAGGTRQLSQLIERQRDLYQAAVPILRNLRDILRESGSVIMLTDAVGSILYLDGESHARHAGERINLAPGGRWAEEAMGTNAIGTAIAAHQPVQIYASEHYCIDVKRWTCAAAPIMDPLNKTLIGVVDVSGLKETFHAHNLGLVIGAAKQIESALASRDLDLRSRLLEHSMDAFARYGNDCVVLFDHRG